MRIALKGGQRAASSDIAALELEIGEPLDAVYRKFIHGNDGALPTQNCFPVNQIAGMGGITRFISVKDVVAERQYVDDIAQNAYPIAFSEGGNYVVLDQSRGGAIFFWDHEVEEGMSKIADDFDAFMEMLEPFDLSDIDTSADEGATVWVDPEFLKKFGG